MAAAVRERDIGVDGVRSRVLETGPADRSEAAVFVHGNPNSADEWTDLMGRTGEFARAVALDMPGFGRADRPREFGYPVEGYARFLAGALDQLGVRRAHLVLHDFGGPWGLGWATTHPDAFASVVLINTGFLFGFRVHSLGKIWATPGLGELFMAVGTPALFRAVAKSNPGLPAHFIDEMRADSDRGTRRTILKLYRNRQDDDLLHRVAADLRALDRPALVVWGGRDEFVPLRHAEQQREAFPRAEVVVLDKSAHWPFVDDPEGAASAIVPFLRRQLRAGDAGSES